jgi:iron complex transport system ATP-binding protein
MQLQARSVYAGYGRTTVLHGVSIEAGPGEIVGLCGPNGSGKSTLLRVLSGTLAASRGELFVGEDSLPALSARERARRIAFVPQFEPALFDFGVRDVVMMGRYAWSRSRSAESAADREACGHAMAAADILHLGDRPITELSGGEHRRTLLARALAQEAPILLMDEPTAGLDLPHQFQILSLVRAKAAQGSIGAIVALHDLGLAAETCDRVALLSEGRILAQGAPAETLTSENLTRSFGAELRAMPNPIGSGLVISAVSRQTGERKGLKVHVVCGGGSGAALLSALAHAGCQVTCGALNEGDTDLAAARALDIPSAAEAPFSPIGERARLEAERLADAAEAVVLTGMLVGQGNIANLALVSRAQARGTPLLLLDPPPEWDFTGGQAAVLLKGLRDGGARRFAAQSELIASLLSMQSASIRVGSLAPEAELGSGEPNEGACGRR